MYSVHKEIVSYSVLSLWTLTNTILALTLFVIFNFITDFEDIFIWFILLFVIDIFIQCFIVSKISVNPYLWGVCSIVGLLSGVFISSIIGLLVLNVFSIENKYKVVISVFDYGISGAIIGASQSFAMKRSLKFEKLWILASAIGCLMAVISINLISLLHIPEYVFFGFEVNTIIMGISFGLSYSLPTGIVLHKHA